MSKNTRSTLSAGRPSAKIRNSATLSSLKDDETTKRINFNVSSSEHTRLKIYAARQGKSITEVLRELVQQLHYE